MKTKFYLLFILVLTLSFFTSNKVFAQVTDSDNDGIADAVDLDDDNDGIPDRYEFTTGKNGSFVPLSDPEAESDGVPNYKDPANAQCGGLNANGVCINYDADGDGIPNSLDLDSDNDGIPDVVEAGGVDANGDGRLDCTGSCDVDRDGLLTSLDVNDNSAGVYATVDSRLSNGSVPGSLNSFILDTDGDGVPDFLDIDSDNDGIFDLIENGGADANGDGRVDFSGTFQSHDPDNDGLLNLYDADGNNDGIVGMVGTARALLTSLDNNADGIADSWTDGPFPRKFSVDFDSDGRLNYRDLDSDDDGIDDVTEAGGADTDGNGIIGAGNQPVVNNDGYASATLSSPLISTDADTNSDGRPDDDNDNYQTPYNNGGGGMPSTFDPDQDTDSRPNFLDLDSDNDGINDRLESRVDRNGDGISDAINTDVNHDGMIDDKTDADRDGIADIVDGNDTQFGDAISGSGTLNPFNTDGPDPNAAVADSDMIPDYLDLDSDNDGIYDTEESGNGVSDVNNDGIIDCDGDFYTACDKDLDGILPNVDGVNTVIGDAGSETLPNVDGGSEPDYRDLDSDGDTNFDLVQNGPSGAVDADNDGRIDGTDTDGDGIINVSVIDNNTIFGGNGSTVLPVTLAEFKGAINKMSVVLSWKTFTEVNSSYFDIERSTDGINFTNVATVAAHGTTSSVNVYQLTDRSPEVGLNYYRLKLVDADGKIIYSSIIKFRFNERIKGYVIVNPNPVKGNMNVHFNAMPKGVYKLIFTNPLGQVLQTEKFNLIQPNQQIIIKRTTALTRGIYILNVRNENGDKISAVKVLVE